MTSVCTLIVTFNAAPWLRRNLQTLRDSTSPTHVLVVDNASTDETLSMIEGEHPEVELIRLPRNLGFGAANNVGIARALQQGFEFVFLLNQDTCTPAASIAEMAAFLEAHADFDMVSPLHLGPTADQLDRKTLTYYLQPHAASYLSDACTGRVAPHYEIHGTNAAAWFARSSVFSRIGGFDPLFFMYGEDDDFLERLHWHRLRFALLPGTTVIHLRDPNPAPCRTAESIARRVEASLLVDIKRPGLGRWHMAMQLLSKGIVAPLAAFLVDRDSTSLAGHARAAFRLLRRLGQVREHARLCARTGPHFLAVSPHA